MRYFIPFLGIKPIFVEEESLRSVAGLIVQSFYTIGVVDLILWLSGVI